MQDNKKPWLLGGLIAAALIALAVVIFTAVRNNASPYGEVSPEKAKAARERVKARERSGPPGLPVPK
jgi:hypothetical protein